MSEMMEMIRALVREKGKTAAPNPQNKTAQSDLRSEEPVYPVGFTPPYALNVHVAQVPSTQQAGGFLYGYASLPTQVNEVGQNSRANTADPIMVSDLDDPKEQEKLRSESLEQFENNEAQRKLELIEKCLKAVEGFDMYGLVDARMMSLIPDLVLPLKFKVPTFDKYDGTKCPSTHLYMYYRKMTGYTSNDKLLIQSFQDSLTGSATKWYNQLSQD